MVPWMLTQDELRRRVCKILDARAENGWTPTTLGEAMELSDPGADVQGKCQRGKWIGRNEQMRMCRIVHLIETGRLQPVRVLCNRGMYVSTRNVAMRCEPPKIEPKTTFRAVVGKRGIRVQMERNRPATESELYLEAP